MKKISYCILVFLLFFLTFYNVAESKEQVNREEIVNYILNNNPISSSYLNKTLFFRYKDFGILVKKDDKKLDEVLITTFLRKNKINNVKNYLDVFSFNKKYIYVSEYLPGENIVDTIVTKNHIKSLLDSFFLVDKLLLWNFDLSINNLLVDNDSMYILDFDAVYFIDYDGNFIIDRGIRNEQEFCSQQKECLIEYLNSGTIGEDKDNPYYDIHLPIPSNLHSFEYRTLSRILSIKRNLSEFEEQLFFEEYLKEKSTYHKRRYNEFKKILNKRFVLKPEVFYSFRRGLRIEKALSNCLKLKNSNIYNIEYAKMHIYNISFLYRHDDENDTTNPEYKKRVDSKIQEQFATIEENLYNLKISRTKENQDDDIALYIQGTQDWVNYWKNYSNKHYLKK